MPVACAVPLLIKSLGCGNSRWILLILRVFKPRAKRVFFVLVVLRVALVSYNPDGADEFKTRKRGTIRAYPRAWFGGVTDERLARLLRSPACRYEVSPKLGHVGDPVQRRSHMFARLKERTFPNPTTRNKKKHNVSDFDHGTWWRKVVVFDGRRFRRRVVSRS